MVTASTRQLQGQLLRNQTHAVIGAGGHRGSGDVLGNAASHGPKRIAHGLPGKSPSQGLGALDLVSPSGHRPEFNPQPFGQTPHLSYPEDTESLLTDAIDTDVSVVWEPGRKCTVSGPSVADAF